MRYEAVKKKRNLLMFVLLLISLLEVQYPKLIPPKGAIFVNLNEHFPNAHCRILNLP
jgi:hypothetical protein